ncbi:MAG: aspartyl protease family protein [Candidatus Acidiferrales bacterium]
MRTCAAAAVFVLAFWQLSQSATKQSVTPPVAVVPFRDTGHIYIKGGISGFRDLSMVIDTGAPESVLSQTIYLQLKLPFTGMVNFPGGFGGGVMNPMPTTSVPFIRFGSSAIKNLPFIVLPPDFIPKMPGAEVDAIIGSELFNHYVVELDYPNKVVRLYDPVNYREPQSGCKLPLRLGPKPSPLPLVHAKIVTKAGRSVDAVLFLDTGGQVAVMLTNVFTMQHPELLKDVPTHSEEADGIGASTRFRIGRVPAIQLGACTIHDPMVAFSQDKRGMGQGGDFFSGEIGLSVFRRFTTIFDYPAGFVVFQSNAASSEGGNHK